MVTHHGPDLLINNKTMADMDQGFAVMAIRTGTKKGGKGTMVMPCVFCFI
jgi:hypothetical protein